MRIVREGELIWPGDGHLFRHAESEEGTSGSSRLENLWLQSDTRR